jgi:hypothetical protein
MWAFCFVSLLVSASFCIVLHPGFCTLVSIQRLLNGQKWSLPFLALAQRLYDLSGSTFGRAGGQMRVCPNARVRETEA